MNGKETTLGEVLLLRATMLLIHFLVNKFCSVCHIFRPLKYYVCRRDISLQTE